MFSFGLKSTQFCKKCLFDLKKDPGEFVDQSKNPDYASMVLHYSQKMLSWRMNHDEQTLTHIKLTEEGPAYREAPRY